MARKTDGQGFMNLDGMSVEELEALREQATERIEELKAKHLEEAFARLDEVAKGLGLDRSKIVSHYSGSKRSSARKPAAQKYRNPNDANQTWSGRGRKPAWVHAHLEAGGDLDAVRI